MWWGEEFEAKKSDRPEALSGAEDVPNSGAKGSGEGRSLMTEQDASTRGQQLFVAIRSNPRLLLDQADLLDREPIEVLVSLLAYLAVADFEVHRFIPVVQAILDRKLHEEQVASQTALRSTMENVSKTLVDVERNQRRIEVVGIFIGLVGLVLAGAQVWAVH